MHTVTVLWGRHGENEANVTHQFSHRRVDLELTALGREQAERLADRLSRRLKGDDERRVLFSSPLRRARQTSAIVSARLGSVVRVLEGLRELDVGELDGRRDPAAWNTYESVLADWRQGRHERSFPGGENYQQLQIRLRTCLVGVANEVRGGTAVVIAHGANVRAALPALAGVDHPGSDIAVGEFAELQVVTTGAANRIHLLHWR